ncbi:MAG: transcriptional repressor [Gammaproteobacteria bacterium]|nr:transcriptional repressor [Gammaproteobacteria bacterium]
MSRDRCVKLLREHGITPTTQRVDIGFAVLSGCEHLSAEDVFASVNTGHLRVSKATVYNTLGLFVEKGLIREVIADPSKTFYDPNTSPHHHFYDVSAGKLTDIDGTHITIVGLPPLPKGKKMAGVDVVVRLCDTA